MKKIFCIVLVVSMTALTAFAQVSDQGSGILRELTGDVQLKHAGASEFVSAKTGAEIAQDTIVSTGFKSTAVIAVGGSVISVRPLTRLSLAEIQLSSETENVNMNLQSGHVRVDVKPPAGARANFTVKSPSATASVRGTVFDFDTRSLRVIEGKVSFRGNNGIAMPVTAGGESFVGSEGNAVDPVEIAEASLQTPPPVGADSNGSSGSMASADGDISVSFDYNEE